MSLHIFLFSLQLRKGTEELVGSRTLLIPQSLLRWSSWVTIFKTWRKTSVERKWILPLKPWKQRRYHAGFGWSQKSSPGPEDSRKNEVAPKIQWKPWANDTIRTSLGGDSWWREPLLFAQVQSRLHVGNLQTCCCSSLPILHDTQSISNWGRVNKC